MDSQGYKDWRKRYISLTCTNSHTKYKTDGGDGVIKKISK